MKTYIIPQTTSASLLPSRMLCGSSTPINNVTGGNVGLNNNGNASSQEAAF